MAHFRKRGFFGGLKNVEVLLEGDELITRRWSGAEPRHEQRRRHPWALDRRVAFFSAIDAHREWERVDPLPAGTFCDLSLEAEPTPEALSVFADQLSERGDPWGQLVQLALLRRGDEGAKSALEFELERLCVERFLPGAQQVLAHLNGSVEWVDGLPRGVVLGDWRHFDTRAMQHALGELTRAPLARAATHWTLGVLTGDGDAVVDEHLDALQAIAPPASHLQLGITSHQLSWIELPQPSRLDAFPRLTSVRVRGGIGTLEPFALPGLTEFSVETGSLQPATLEAIAAAPWPQLERLDVSFGSYESTVTIAETETFLARLEAPKLRHLGLRACEFPHELIPVLAKWPPLARLTSLDLSRGGLQPADVLALEPHWPAFAHLTRFDLSDNMVARAGPNRAVHLDADAAARLARHCPAVTLGFQRDENEVDGARFATLGE